MSQLPVRKPHPSDKEPKLQYVEFRWSVGGNEEVSTSCLMCVITYSMWESTYMYMETRCVEKHQNLTGHVHIHACLETTTTPPRVRQEHL